MARPNEFQRVQYAIINYGKRAPRQYLGGFRRLRTVWVMLNPFTTLLFTSKAEARKHLTSVLAGERLPSNLRVVAVQLCRLSDEDSGDRLRASYPELISTGEK